MDSCVFCKIANVAIPAHKVYEDEQHLAFLGIYPPVEGFTLVIPKAHSEDIWQLPADDYQALWDVVSRVGQRLKAEFTTKRVGIQVEGLEVPHVHVKLLPINSGEQFRAPEPTTEPNHAELAALAERLKF